MQQRTIAKRPPTTIPTIAPVGKARCLPPGGKAAGETEEEEEGRAEVGISVADNEPLWVSVADNEPLRVSVTDNEALRLSVTEEMPLMLPVPDAVAIGEADCVIVDTAPNTLLWNPELVTPVSVGMAADVGDADGVALMLGARVVGPGVVVGMSSVSVVDGGM